MRTLYVKVIRDRRAERLEYQPVRPVGARRGFHGQLKEVVLGASAPADQGRRDGRRRNSQRRVRVEQAAHELLSEVGGHGTCCGACLGYNYESATQTDAAAKLCDDFEKTCALFFPSSSSEEKKNSQTSSSSLPLSLFSSLHHSPLTWLHGADRAQQLELHVFVAAAEPPQDAVTCRALGDARCSERGSQQRLHDGQGLSHDRDVCPRQGNLSSGVPQDEHAEGVHRLFVER